MNVYGTDQTFVGAYITIDYVTGLVLGMLLALLLILFMAIWYETAYKQAMRDFVNENAAFLQKVEKAKQKW